MSARKRIDGSGDAPQDGDGADRRWPAEWGEPSKEERHVPPPDWTQWDAESHVTLEQAVLLSLDYCPDFFQGESIAKLLSADSARKLFDERLRRLQRWCEGTTILLADFAALAMSEFKWDDLPPRLVALAKVQACAATVTGEIPGKMPRTGAGNLAVKAAWQIECEKGRAATTKDVMTRLQGWADDGTEPDVLLKSGGGKRGVMWRTKKGTEKLFDNDACGKALETWRKSWA